MEEAVTSSILKGRPWGGVIILINNKLSRKVNTHMCTDRCVIVFIDEIMLINVYVPSASQVNNQKICDLLDEITGIVDQKGFKHLIFGGDLNYNLHKPSFTSDLVANFMANLNLKFVDENAIPN